MLVIRYIGDVKEHHIDYILCTGFKNIKEVTEACFDVLSPAINPPTSLDKDQLACIKLLLSLLHDMGVSSAPLTFYNDSTT